MHNLGFPRIYKQRELKRGLETYWRQDIRQSLREAVRFTMLV
ncbi:hypothetical protein [Alkalimonas collagenimarina]